MRLSLIFLMIILLPVAAVVHAWLFARDELPRLVADARSRLEQAGITNPVVTLHCLDIDIAGEAPDPPAHERAVAAVRAMGVVRLKPEADRIHVYAGISSRLEGRTLHLAGWLPEEKDTRAVAAILAELRPDLTLDTMELRHAAEVRWPEDFQSPLDASDPFLAPVLDGLHVPAQLKIESRADGTILLSGMLPAGGVREELLAALSASVLDPSGLKSSAHVRPAPFAKKQVLAAFVSSFFAAPPPRRFEISEQAHPRIEGLATRRQESDWLALLRPVTGGEVIDAQLNLMPSEFHFPGRLTRSQVPAATLEPLRQVLADTVLVFENGSSRIPQAEQARLASITPALLSAGPALALVIAGHPDPDAADAARESALALARAEAVLSFLIEQGVPATDITAIACDPVPPGSPGAPAGPGSVEILIK
ncbi:MAG: OmpA family [Verrucomicrobiota bacterium]|jgi:outer membrane protein OmpA-like peptidoglycan-associated protein